MKPLFLLLVVLFGGRAGTQVPKQLHPIDVAFLACLKGIPAANHELAVPARPCAVEALRQWQAELARLVAADKRPRAKAEQAAWVKKSDAKIAALRRHFKKYANTDSNQDVMRAEQIQLLRERVTYLGQREPPTKKQ